MANPDSPRPRSPGPDSPSSPPPSAPRVPLLTFWLLGLALLLSWLTVAYLLLNRAPHPAPDPNPPSAYDDLLRQCPPGPWGDMEYSRLLIEPPEFFVDAKDLEHDEVKWFFKDFTPESLEKLWRQAGLTAAEQSALASATVTSTSPATLTVRPARDLILGLSPQARATIYNALSSFPENPSQNEPFRFRSSAAAEWFANSGLAEDTIQLVTPLLYRRGTSLLFSDQATVLPLLPTRTEKLLLLKTLARKSTLLLKLRVGPGSDIPALARYWGVGPRKKDLLPLLESISHRPRGITIDVSHLLPRFARARLYNYPQSNEHSDDGRHDCHWTSLNFFNDPPDEKFADDEAVRHTLETDYERVVGRPSLGDIFIFARPNGDVIHSCVYIADDIVFTKNGSSSIMPWILMNLPDVIAFYPSEPPLIITAYRRRDL